jgi:transcriptional regulator with XRE-family HTH domain
MNKPYGRQLAAARTLAGLSQLALAEAARISVPTLKRMEASDGPAVGMANNVSAVVTALEAAGVIFIAENGEGPGVRLRKAGPLTFLQFIRQAEKTNDAVGDFIGDARMDRTMPDAADWPELEAYLERRGASQAAINAGEATWVRFTAVRDAKAK